MENPQLSQILAQNGQFVRALARSLVRDPQRAEDLAQETWMRYVARPPQATGSLRHWFRTVVRNLASSGARTEGRRAARDAQVARPEALPSVAEEYAHAELLRGVVEAVLALEEPYRSTLLARYWRGWSAVQVAEETRTPLATVRSREQRALEQLRGKLDKDWTGQRGAWGLALARLLATEPGPAVAVPLAPLAKLGLAGGTVLAGGLAWWALAGTGAAPEARAPELVAAEVVLPSAAEPAPRASEPARESMASAPSVAVPAPSAPESQAFGAVPPSEVRVRFVFSDGTPAAGVACTLALGGLVSRNGVEPSGAEAEDWEDQSATSATDGSVAFTFVMPPEYGIRLTAELPLHAKVSWGWQTVVPGQVLELGDAAMLRAGVITGRLVRPDGTPILGGAWSVNARSIGLSTPEGRGDTSSHGSIDPATGTFRLEGVMPGVNTLSARSSMTGRVEGPNVTLAEGGTVEAEIVFDGPDPARRILVDVSVLRFRTAVRVESEHVRLLAPGAPPRAPDSSTAWGSFTFDDLEPGSYTLEIDDPRCVLWRQEDVQPGSRLGPKLEGNSAIVLAVSAADTGLALTPDEVRLTLRNTNTFPNVFSVQDFVGGRIGGMFAGDSTIEVKAGGRIGHIDVDGLAVGETRAVAVVVAALPPVGGSARFTDGAPAVGLVAALIAPAREEDSDASPILSMGSWSSDLGRYRIEVDSAPVDVAGHFELVAQQDGDYLVRVSGSDGTQAFSPRFALAAAPAQTLELELARPGGLAGSIPVPAGASVAGLRAFVLPVARGVHRADDLSELLSVALQADGRFVLPSVASGPARVFLQLPRPIQHKSGGWSSNGGGWYGERLLLARELGTVTIPASETLTHDFTLDDFPGTVELTVLVNGVPAPWLALTLRSEADEYESLEVGTDERGIYVGPLFAGSYALEASDSTTAWQASVPAAFAITAGRPTIATVELQRP